MFQAFNEFMMSPVGTVFYSVLGMLLMWFFLWVSEKITHFSIKKEIVEEHNVAMGIIIAGAFIGMAIIIAAAIG